MATRCNLQQPGSTQTRHPTQTLKLIQIGNSLGVVLPKEVLAQMNVDKGDSLFMSAMPNGLRITPTHPEFAAQMTAARAMMKGGRDLLAALAK